MFNLHAQAAKHQQFLAAIMDELSPLAQIILN